MLHRVMASLGISQAPLGLCSTHKSAQFLQLHSSPYHQVCLSEAHSAHKTKALAAHVLDHGLTPTRYAEVLNPNATTAKTDAGMCGSARSGSKKKLGISRSNLATGVVPQ